MGQDKNTPSGEDFRTSPAFAELLDRFIQAAQAGDEVAVKRILHEQSEWRSALEEERAFLDHIETTRPAGPATPTTDTIMPRAVHTLPMPLAQTWLAVLDAATTPTRIEAALFTFETCAVYLLATAVGAYETLEAEDEGVADALRQLGQSRKPRSWLETMDTLLQWSSAAPGDCIKAPPVRSSPLLGLLSEIHDHLAESLDDPAILELLAWLDRLDAEPARAGEGASLRALLERILAHRMAVDLRPAAMVRGADAERTAELLEAALAALLRRDSLIHGLPCAHVRTVERIGKDLFQHGIVDLRGVSPLTRRGGLLLDGQPLEPGRMYVLDGGNRPPIPLHPFFVFQDGKTLRLSFARDRKGFSYSACMAGEGRIDRAVRIGGYGRIEALLMPRLDGDDAASCILDPGVKEVIGDFRILRQIGEGGMALVYLAEQRSIGREVALKVLHKSRLTSGFVERFRREGKAIGRLEHPNIVKVHAIGEEDGIPYLAMEYIHGSSLEKLLRGADGGEVTLPRAAGDRSAMESICRITREIALALEQAHNLGIVHRDVKPGNILMDEDGHAHLSDFGLAQERGKASLTRTGDMVGTPHFLSPEQVAAKRIEVDHRTDVYSLGVALYQMLTGRLPFIGETLEQILRQIALKEPLPPRKHNPRIPRDLETLCLHAMEKDPDARYASIQDMADDLKAVTELRPIQASRVGPMGRMVKLARRRPAVAVLTLLLAAALVTWGATLLHRISRDAAAVQESLRFGRAMVDVGRQDHALPYFKRVLDLDPGNGEARANVNRILFHQDLARAYELAFDQDNPEDDTPGRRCLDLLARIPSYGQNAGEADFLKAQVLVRLGRNNVARMKEALEFIDGLDETETSIGLQLLRAAALDVLDPVEGARVRMAAEARKPGTDQDRLVLAGARMAEEKWQDALNLYNELLRRGDRNLELTAASQAARCCYWQKNYDAALKHLRLLEREHGRQPHLLRRRALYLWGSGERDLALKALDEALERSPDYVLALRTRGFFLYMVHRYEEALKPLDRAVALDPTSSLNFVTRSQVYGYLSDFPRALKDINRVLALRPDFAYAFLSRSRIYDNQGEQYKTRLEHRKAQESWRKALHDQGRALELQPGSARTLAERAQVHLKAGNTRFAREDAERALELDPDLGQAHYALGLIHYSQGDKKQALNYLDRAITNDPGFPGALEIRAHLYGLEGRYEDALADLDQALEHAPRYIQARLNRAVVYLELDRLDEAEADLEAVLEKVERAEAYVTLSQINMKRGPDLDLAQEALEQALALGPELLPVHMNLGRLFCKEAGTRVEDPGKSCARAAAFRAESLRLGIRDEEEERKVKQSLTTMQKQAARCFLKGEKPATPLEHALRGFGHWKQGNKEAAAPDLEEGIRGLDAMKTLPDRTRIEHYEYKYAFLVLAELAEGLGRLDRSIALYRRLKTLDPDHPLALKKVRNQK